MDIISNLLDFDFSYSLLDDTPIIKIPRKNEDYEYEQAFCTKYNY